jgi:hypothetical protein
MKTIGEVSQDTLKLEEFIGRQPHGAVLTYSGIQNDTGVEMNLNGKAHLRQALKHLRREYSSVHGHGIRLADASGVMPILSSRISRINKAVKRADRSQRILQDEFYDSLNDQEKKSVLFAGAVFGAIRLAAEQGRQIQRRNQTMLPTISVPLPTISKEAL